MAQHPTSSAPTPTSAGSSDLRQADYAERLRAPWWLWLGGLALAAFAAAEVYLGAPGWLTWVPYLVLVALAALGLWWLGRIRVAVRDGELWVDDAHLPVRYVAKVGVLDAAGKRSALGPQADPLAFIVQRPWISGAVLVVLDDPADPTPYWLISARRPERVARALLAAQTPASRRPADGATPGSAGSATG